MEVSPSGGVVALLHQQAAALTEGLQALLQGSDQALQFTLTSQQAVHTVH